MNFGSGILHFKIFGSGILLIWWLSHMSYRPCSIDCSPLVNCIEFRLIDSGSWVSIFDQGFYGFLFLGELLLVIYISLFRNCCCCCNCCNCFAFLKQFAVSGTFTYWGVPNRDGICFYLFLSPVLWKYQISAFNSHSFWLSNVWQCSRGWRGSFYHNRIKVRNGPYMAIRAFTLYSTVDDSSNLLESCPKRKKIDYSAFILFSPPTCHKCFLQSHMFSGKM